MLLGLDLMSLLSSLSHFWLLMVASSVFGLVTGLWLSAMPPALISLLGIRGNIIIIIIITLIITVIIIIIIRSGLGIWSPDPH